MARAGLSGRRRLGTEAEFAAVASVPAASRVCRMPTRPSAVSWSSGSTTTGASRPHRPRTSRWRHRAAHRRAGRARRRRPGLVRRLLLAVQGLASSARRRHGWRLRVLAHHLHRPGVGQLPRTREAHRPRLHARRGISRLRRAGGAARRFGPAGVEGAAAVGDRQGTPRLGHHGSGRHTRGSVRWRRRAQHRQPVDPRWGRRGAARAEPAGASTGRGGGCVETINGHSRSSETAMPGSVTHGCRSVHHASIVG